MYINVTSLQLPHFSHTKFPWNKIFSNLRYTAFALRAYLFCFDRHKMIVRVTSGNH